MTDAEILTQFEGLVDDSLDQTLEIQLANNAKNKLERELKLLIHQKERATNTTSANQTYTTAISLAADFRAWVTLYIGTELYLPIPFRHRVNFRDTAMRYYTDHRLQKFYLTGTQSSSQTITETYIYKTDDITAASVALGAAAGGTTVTWPTEFHGLIAYEMAKLFYAIDAGDKARSWDDRWEAHAQLIRKALIEWDHDLKLQEMQDSSFIEDSPTNSEDRPPI